QLNPQSTLASDPEKATAQLATLSLGLVPVALRDFKGKEINMLGHPEILKRLQVGDVEYGGVLAVSRFSKALLDRMFEEIPDLVCGMLNEDWEFRS
ncbi:hypothetical protein BGX29_002961, partial [Mortierella sp. GBA35]